MIVLDASVALKWFVDDEPLVEEARRVLDDIEAQPATYIVPDLFMNEVLELGTAFRNYGDVFSVRPEPFDSAHPEPVEG